MYKSIFALLIVGLLLAGPALAVPATAGWEPPVNPYDASEGYGWGMSTWQDACLGGFSEYALYDGTDPTDCSGWTVFQGFQPTNIQFRALMGIHLWIEVYAQMTIHNTSIQLHETGGVGGDYFFYIGGVIRSNYKQQVCLDGNGMSGNYIEFQEDIFGNDDPAASDFGVTWKYKTGELAHGANIPDPPAAGWLSFDPPDSRCIDFEPCDHWFWIQGKFCKVYHEHDGYYVLDLIICPTPIL